MNQGYFVTRVTPALSSLIDVFLTTWPRPFHASGVFGWDLSDHHIIYAITKAHCPRQRPRINTKRCFKNYVPELFSKDVSRIHRFHIANIFYDTDDICWAWTKLLSDVLDDHAPMKQSTIRRQHVPFMSLELLDAIRLRSKLKKIYSKTNDPTDFDKYEARRSLTSSLKIISCGEKLIMRKVIPRNFGRLSSHCYIAKGQQP